MLLPDACWFRVIILTFVLERPDAIDSALRRPGRLDRELELRAPTVAERKEILAVLLDKIPHRLDTKQVEHLASVTHGFVGADLSLLCAESSLAAAKRIISSSSSGKLVESLGCYPFLNIEFSLFLFGSKKIRLTMSLLRPKTPNRHYI